MSFSVLPDRIDAWSARLTSLLDDADAATAYAEQHLRCLPGGGGMMLAAAAALDDARVAMTGSTTALRALLAGSAGELGRSAVLYRQTDTAEAARLDALLPGDPVAAMPADVPDTADPDARENPATTLTPPVATDPVPDAFEAVLSLPDIVSPTAWTLWVIEAVCGVNLLDHLTSHVAGDWAAFSRAAAALDDLGGFHSAMGGAIAAETDAVLGGAAPPWTGEAAGAAGEYFAGFAEAVARQAGPAAGLARECRAFSSGMYHVAEGLGSAVKFVLDLAAVAAISAAAASLTAYTGVGALVGGAATLAALAQTGYAWISVVGRITDAYGFVALFVGQMALVAAGLREVSEHPLPAGAYDHAGV